MKNFWIGGLLWLAALAFVTPSYAGPLDTTDDSYLSQVDESYLSDIDEGY